MLVVFVRDYNHAAKPFFILDKLSDVRLGFASTLDANNSRVVIHGWCLRGQRGWRRVLEQKLSDATSYTVHAELCFLDLISRGKENDMAILRNVMLGSKLLSNTTNSLFKICCEELTVDQKGVGLKQIFKFLILRIEMSHGIIGAILTSEFTWETEAIRGCSLDGNGIMDEIDIAASPLLVVLDELVMEVTCGEIVCAVLIITYKLN